jgi:MFS family permease
VTLASRAAITEEHGRRRSYRFFTHALDTLENPIAELALADRFSHPGFLISACYSRPFRFWRSIEKAALNEARARGVCCWKLSPVLVIDTALSSRVRPACARNAPLDWLNFLLADVQGGLGPFLAIYLTASRHWHPGSAGLMLTIGGLATVAASTPLGGLVDRVRWKRALVATAAAVVALAAMTEALLPRPWPVALAQLGSGIADAAFPSAIAALSLGLVGRAAYSARVGRNQAYNHAGNVVTAALSGVAGWLINPVAVLWAVTAFSVGSIVVVRLIDSRAIDHTVARGADDGHGKEPGAAGGFKTVLTCRPLLLFTLSITLFHFANAAMLPLAGERLARGASGGVGTLLMASCIVVAQLVMVPASVLVGQKADSWGRKRLFLVGFAALPLRGVLFALLSAPVALIGIQVLDGVGAGIFGALFPIVVADLTRGTGRYNLALGAASACWGLGAAVSNGVAGAIVDRLGFSAAFLVLGAFALGALALFALAVPETRPAE